LRIFACVIPFRLFFFPVIVLALQACGEDARSGIQAPCDSTAKIDPAGKTKEIVYDTVRNSQVETGIKEETDTIEIRGKQYLLEIKAQLDMKQPLDTTVTLETESKIEVYTVKGCNARYSIRLKDENGKTVFSKSFDKTIFDKSSLVIISNAYPPSYIGYNRAFDKLMFRITFGQSESDWLTDYLMMIDLKGNITSSVELFMYTSPSFSSDSSMILTGDNLLNSDGRVISLQRNDKAFIASELINDSTVLAAYSLDSTRTDNMYFVNNRGETLGSFRWHRFEGGLGTYINLWYVGSLRCFYMADFDPDMRELRIIPKDDPLDMKVIRLDDIPAFRPPKLNTEEKLYFDNESGSSSLYVDTISGKLRVAR
jgi:hypothetical protein